MKNKYISLLILISTFHYQLLFGQELTFTNEIPEVREKFVGLDDQTLLYYNHYSDFSNSLNSLEYISTGLSDAEPKATKFTPKIDVDGFNRGAIKSIFVNGEGFVYEAHQLSKSSGEGKTLLIKREISTLKETKRLILDQANVALCKNDGDKIYLVGEKNYYQIDFDLNVIQDRPHDLFSHPDAEVRLDTAVLDRNSNVLVSIMVRKPEKFSLLGTSVRRNSSLYFGIFDNEGELTVINPELPSTIHNRHFRFNYDAQKDELTALFITSDEPKKSEFIGQGFSYVYIRWDKTGEILATNEHRFSFSEFKSDDLSRYAKLSKFDPENFEFKYLDYTTPGNIEFLKNGTVLYITDILNALPGPIFNSKLIFMTTNEGKLSWCRILPFSNSELYKKSAYVLKGEQLHFLSFDYLENYKNGTYTPMLTSGKFNGINSGLTERVISLNSGEIVSNKVLTASKSEQFIPLDFIYKSSDGVLFKFVYSQKNKEQILKINY